MSLSIFTDPNRTLIITSPINLEGQTARFLSTGHAVKLLNADIERLNTGFLARYPKPHAQTAARKVVDFSLKYFFKIYSYSLSFILASGSFFFCPLNYLETLFHTTNFLGFLACSKHFFLESAKNLDVILLLGLLLSISHFLKDACLVGGDVPIADNSHERNEAKRRLDETIAKIQNVIANLNITINSENPVEMQALVYGISQLDLSKLCLQAMLNGMNMGQILTFRRISTRIDFDFDSLESLLASETCLFFNLLKDFSNSENLRESLEKLNLSVENLDAYIEKNDPTVWEVLVQKTIKPEEPYESTYMRTPFVNECIIKRIGQIFFKDEASLELARSEIKRRNTSQTDLVPLVPRAISHTS